MSNFFCSSFTLSGSSANRVSITSTASSHFPWRRALDNRMSISRWWCSCSTNRLMMGPTSGSPATIPDTWNTWLEWSMTKDTTVSVIGSRNGSISAISSGRMNRLAISAQRRGWAKSASVVFWLTRGILFANAASFRTDRPLRMARTAWAMAGRLGEINTLWSTTAR